MSGRAVLEVSSAPSGAGASGGAHHGFRSPSATSTRGYMPRPLRGRNALGVVFLILALAALGAWQVAPEAPRAGETDAPARGQAPGVRFTHFDVFLDSGDKALGAYQVELRCTTSNVTLVGIEGGEHGAYKEPPYYDPAALHNPRGSRVILAAFNTGSDLPAGKTRVARIHVQVTGPAPEFVTRLVAAADGSGGPIEAAVTLVAGEDK